MRGWEGGRCDKKGEDGRVGGVIRRERMGGWEV